VGSRRLISNREACPTQSSPFEGYPNNLRPLSSYHETRSFSSAVQRQRVIKSGCFDVNNYHLTLEPKSADVPAEAAETSTAGTPLSLPHTDPRVRRISRAQANEGSRL
jgi:hypothetical protein